MTDYIFKTPTEDESPLAKNYPFTRFKLTRGISVANSSGTYSLVRTPSGDDIADYTAFYLGGGTHTVTSAVRTALIAADIGIDSSNFTAI